MFTVFQILTFLAYILTSLSFNRLLVGLILQDLINNQLWHHPAQFMLKKMGACITHFNVICTGEFPRGLCSLFINGSNSYQHFPKCLWVEAIKMLFLMRPTSYLDLPTSGIAVSCFLGIMQITKKRKKTEYLSAVPYGHSAHHCDGWGNIYCKNMLGEPSLYNRTYIPQETDYNLSQSVAAAQVTLVLVKVNISP